MRTLHPRAPAGNRPERVLEAPGAAVWEHSESLQHVKFDPAQLLELQGAGLSAGSIVLVVHLAQWTSGNPEGVALKRTTLAEAIGLGVRSVARRVAEICSKAPGLLSVRRGRARVYENGAWRRGADRFGMALREGSGRIWKAAMTHPAFLAASPTQAVFFLHVWSRWGDGRGFWGSMREFCETLGGWSETTVRDCIRYWKAWGWLEVGKVDHDNPWSSASYRCRSVKDMRSSWSPATSPTVAEIREQRTIRGAARVLGRRLAWMAEQGASILVQLGRTLVDQAEPDGEVLDQIRALLKEPTRGIPYRGPRGPSALRKIGALAFEERERFREELEGMEDAARVAHFGTPPPQSGPPAEGAVEPLPPVVDSAEWTAARDRLEERFGVQNYGIWIEPVTFHGRAGDLVLLGVPNRYYADWILEHYQAGVVEELERAFGRRPLRLEIRSES